MRSIFILAFVLISFFSHGQIALEHTFNDYFLEVVNFSNINVGQKFVTNTEQVNFYSHPDTLTIYTPTTRYTSPYLCL